MKLEVKYDYCTGNYAMVGGGKNWLEVEELPTKDITKLKAHRKLPDGTLEFDEEKYNTLMSEQQAEKLAVFKCEKIAQSKENLKACLEVTKLVSDVHGTVKEYSITSDKQNRLDGMIHKAQFYPGYVPSWNASGEPATYDWTLEQLQQLAIEIDDMVRPLADRQRMMEMEIQSASTMEEVEAVDILF